jgi:UDP-N-acetylmuramoyl-L-alanyl-D-glutamate--2,6-diaminopimelate ligase
MEGKKLSELLAKVNTLEVKGNADVTVNGVVIDSRQVKEGHLFVAVRGSRVDGHEFVAKAVELGAVAVLCEELPADCAEGVTYVRVANTEQCVGEVASAFFGYPSKQLQLVGVTGTNGKTTVATTLYNLCRHLGYKAGLLSTVCNYVDGEALPTVNTTPDAVTLNALLARMVEAGCSYAFMEVSSHSVVQNRIGGLYFAGGVFTNLTQDHLDYHGTFENYRNAKKSFFDSLPSDAFALTNADDKNGGVMVQNTKATVKTYSVERMADFRAKILECHFEGMYLQMNGKEVGVQFVGRFNVQNLLAVYGTAVLLGLDSDAVLVGLSEMKPVSGRFEAFRSQKGGYTVIVDYAHTDDALTNVLTAIHSVLEGNGKVITVCGAGGNRDKTKRPKMARAALKQSDVLIVTSDNPRFEEPQDIINDMLAGLEDEAMQRLMADEGKKVVSIVDRREAIKTACLLAQKGDVVLVAGKGHEDYQEVKGVKHHFDDREEVRNAIGNH